MLTVHTYPEYHPETSIATFRVDIDVATCGQITPLSTLDFLIGSFDSDIITIDYRVRGLPGTWKGEKIFIDHSITSIQDYIKPGHFGVTTPWTSMCTRQYLFHSKC